MLSSVKELLIILISSSLISNVVLSQFLGICPFLGVSKKVETASGMGMAIIFVITLASAVAAAISFRFRRKATIIIHQIYFSPSKDLI